MRKYTILLSILVTLSVRGQSVFNFDTYNLDDALIEEVFDTLFLANTATYTLTVEGTYAVWHPSQWSGPCGAPEAAPVFSSAAGSLTGQVAYDMSYVFAMPDAHRCMGKTLPDTTSRIQISLDNGATWIHPAPLTSGYNATHQYTYSITGQGYPIGVRHNSAINSDDYGVLRFTITQTSTAANEIETQKGSIQLYPNPVNDWLRLDTELEMNFPIVISFINEQGQEVKRETLTDDAKIDVTDLPSGLYFISLSDSHGKLLGAQKLIRE